MTRVLVAGMGNVLRGDDGFGVALARRLAREPLPPGVHVVEVGIGGIHLVQELMDGYDALVVLDALECGARPGTLRLLEAEVPDLASWSDVARADFLADMHYTTPSRALVLAKALGVLPPRVVILGCQPTETDDLGIGLTAPVADATTAALVQLHGLLAQLQQRAATERQ